MFCVCVYVCMQKDRKLDRKKEGGKEEAVRREGTEGRGKKGGGKRKERRKGRRGREDRGG